MNLNNVTDRPDPRRLTAGRRFGYRLLPGDGFSYILHLRPREWAIVAGHTAFGFLLALVSGPEAIDWSAAALGILLFVVFLNGGTLAINSAFDRDEGDVGYLDAPPPPPRHLFAFGFALMAVGQLVAASILPSTFAMVYAACFVMSMLYSVPPFRWKAIAGVDLVINALGFGILTPLAGWTLSGAPIPGWAWFVLVGFGFLFAALYPLTQLYQFEEDRARGDRTLALILGERASLIFAIAMALAAFATIGHGLFHGPGGWLTALIALPLLAWLALLLRWIRRWPDMSATEHKQGMYRALQAWALTNAAVLAALLL